MAGFLAIGLVAAGLIVVALTILAADIARGDVGGGRHTLSRARRLLVVSTDERTAEAGDAWIARQRKEHPQMQFFVLNGEDGQELYMDIQGAIERNRPDGIVLVRPGEVRHATLEGLFGRLKEDGDPPVDAIYAEDEVTA